MIEVACSNCGKKYRVDEGKIKGQTAKFRCKSCGETVVVRKQEVVSEHQTALRRVFDRGVAPHATCGKEITRSFVMPISIFLERFVCVHIEEMPVIESRPF